MSLVRATAFVLAAGSCLLGGKIGHADPQQARPGEVAGRVVDFDETPLPGIDVALTGPFPEITRLITAADANARFLFTDVVPGRYRLEIEQPNLSAGSDVDVTVRPGQRTETMLVLNLQGTAVNVIVQAEVLALVDTDLVDSESTAGLRIVPGTTIQTLPLPAEQALEVLPLLPTVVRGPKGRIAIAATMPADSVLLFNGIDLTDGYSGDFSLRIPIEAVDRVDLFTGIAPARYGNITGGIIDISTLPGGESWEWGIASVFPRPRFQDGTVMGLKNASPRLRVSGPLKPGTTYLALAGEYHFDRVDVYDVPGDPAQDHVRLEGWNVFGQVDWRPSDRHDFTFSGLAFPSYDKFVGLDGLTPPQATLNLERDAEGILGRYRFRIDRNRTLETVVQFNRVGMRSEAQGGEPYQVLTGGVDGNHFHAEDRQTNHFQAQVLQRLRFPADGGSSHVVEFGTDFHRFGLSGTLADGTILVLGAQGQLLQRIDFSPASQLDQRKYEWSLFVQDRWTRSDRIWFDLGLRYESDSYTGDHRLAPRIGVAWDPAGNRRTLIKGGAGIVYRRVFLGEMAWRQLPSRFETTFDSDGGATLRSLVPRIADDLDVPRTIQFTGDVSHRLESGWMFRAHYSHRATDHNIIVDRIDGPGISIDPDAILADLDVETIGQGGTLLLSSTGEADAWTVELTVAKRIPFGGEVVVSYVRSSSFGDLNDFRIMAADFPEAIIRPNRRAQRQFDATDRIVAWATIELPSAVLLTPVVEWRTGFPYSVVAEDQSYVGPANSERFPDFFALDLQATKTFDIKGYRITGGVKITNITSHDNPRQVISNVADDNFGDFRNSVPLKVRMVFAFRF